MKLRLRVMARAGCLATCFASAAHAGERAAPAVDDADAPPTAESAEIAEPADADSPEPSLADESAEIAAGPAEIDWSALYRRPIRVVSDGRTAGGFSLPLGAGIQALLGEHILVGFEPRFVVDVFGAGAVATFDARLILGARF